MRVVIDAVPLLIRSAGVKNYLYHWIDHLRLAAPPETIANCDQAVKNEGFRTIRPPSENPSDDVGNTVLLAWRKRMNRT